MGTGENDFRHLLSPITVGRVPIRNRVVSSAHLTNFARDGLPTERQRAYWVEKARGGVGLIITEGSLVHESSYSSDTRFIEFWRPEVVDALAPVTEAVRAHGARLVAQLNHMGRSWAPSPWPRTDGTRPHAMTKREIAEVVTAFATAAGRAQQAGADGVEVHAAHGYLIEQFLSPLSNQRADEYGGNERNRMRLLEQVVDATRDTVGPDFMVGLRITGDQFQPGGLTLADAQRIYQAVTASGSIDFLNASYYRNQDYGPASNSIVPMYVPEGRFVYLAAALKAVVDIPVITVNRIVDPHMAENIIATGQADLVAMTRAQIADPQLVEKIRSGRLDEIRPCIGINEGCLGQVMNGSAGALTCAVNPSAGHEHQPLLPAEHPRPITVVGGGIAGLDGMK